MNEQMSQTFIQYLNGGSDVVLCDAICLTLKTIREIIVKIMIVLESKDIFALKSRHLKNNLLKKYIKDWKTNSNTFETKSQFAFISTNWENVNKQKRFQLVKRA